MRFQALSAGLLGLWSSGMLQYAVEKIGVANVAEKPAASS